MPQVDDSTFKFGYSHFAGSCRCGELAEVSCVGGVPLCRDIWQEDKVLRKLIAAFDVDVGKFMFVAG